MNNFDLTAIALNRFFDALGMRDIDKFVWAWGPYHHCDAFSDGKPEWCPWGSSAGTRTDFMRDLPRLRQLNRSKNHGGRECSIFMRVPTSILYLDDMTSSGVAALKALGVAPRAIIETSSGSHQVHLRLPTEISALKLYLGIETKLGADPNAHPASDGLQTRYARMPGFINTKPNRNNAWVKGQFSTRPESTQSIEALRELAEHGNKQQINTTPPIGAGAASAPRRRPSTAAESSQCGLSDVSESGNEMRMAVRMAYQGICIEEITRAVYERRVTRGKLNKDSMRNAAFTAKNAKAWVLAHPSRH